MQSRAWNVVIVVLLLVLLLAVGALVLLSLSSWRSPVDRVEQELQQQVDELLNPTPTILPGPTAIIHEIRSLSRLETASYTIEKVITAESGQGPLGFLFGDRLLLVAHGQVIAGIDLGRMGAGDIAVTDEGQVVVILPPAEVFVTTLSNDKSYIYDRDTGVLGLNVQLETAARQVAETQILETALEDGILDKARDNARVYVRGLIMALGYDQVIFLEATPVPGTPVPPTPAALQVTTQAIWTVTPAP